jgi:hypothetical protein
MRVLPFKSSWRSTNSVGDKEMAVELLLIMYFASSYSLSLSLSLSFS